MKLLTQLSIITFTLVGCLTNTAFSNSNFKKAALTVNYTKTDVSCFGQSNGSIELSISGGKAPYIVVWNNGVESVFLDNLSKGVYSVNVTDANGMSINENIEINMPSPLMLKYGNKDEVFLNALNGNIDVAFGGGTPWDMNDGSNYNIRLNDNANIEHPESLEDGIYKLSIEDANGCMLSVKVNIDFEIQADCYSKDKDQMPAYNGLGNVKVSIAKPSIQNMAIVNTSMMNN
jgi:hypothetical protein